MSLQRHEVEDEPAGVDPEDADGARPREPLELPALALVVVASTRREGRGGGSVVLGVVAVAVVSSEASVAVAEVGKRRSLGYHRAAHRAVRSLRRAGGVGAGERSRRMRAARVCGCVVAAGASQKVYFLFFCLSRGVSFPSRHFRESPPMEKVRTLAAPEGTGSVLCCALSPHGSRTSLALGGEDAAACVLDLRAGASSSPVTHRLAADLGCFDADDAVISVTWHPTREHVLLCGHGQVVTAWDIRALPSSSSASDSAAAAVASMSLKSRDGKGADDDADAKAPRGRVHRYAFNNDEVNSVCVDKKGRRMCAADDGGEIAVVDIADTSSHSGKIIKLLKNGHANIASGAQFRDHKPYDVVSGGLDCVVCKWDHSRTTPVATWRVGDLAAAEAAAEAEANASIDGESSVGPAPMCNPPMVHAVACANGLECAETRRLVAAACGDGTVALVDLDLPAPGAKTSSGKTKSKKGGKGSSNKADKTGGVFGATRRVLFLGRDPGTLGDIGHAGACNAVAFAGWSGSRYLVTGGNDKRVGVWDWRVANEIQSNADARHEQHTWMIDSFMKGNSLMGRGSDLIGAYEGPGSRVRFFKHGKKVNWVCAADVLDNPGGFGDTFVADTGTTVAAYALSL